MESGWYRITSSETLSPYEWNSVSLHYGVLGFSVSINGRVSASCDVSQEDLQIIYTLETFLMIRFMSR